jgi:ABC-type polysaccharide/polyol phosphate transport system ATPase subunit
MSFISLNKVNLEFPIYNTQSFSLRHSLVKAAAGGVIKKKEDKAYTVSALKNISFSLNRGDRLGLIGHNGSGKTTLLKVLAGVYRPSSGEIDIKGKVVTLFDVLLGTYEDITGSENLYISSIIRGKSVIEAKNSLKSMGDFTELGDYLHVPMRAYSSGMKLRVGFAVATEGTPDILLIDEIFGTGDKNFVNKSVQRITSLIERSGILVFSSHSESLLSQFCNKIMILEHGEIKALGETAEVLSIYNTMNHPLQKVAI